MVVAIDAFGMDQGMEVSHKLRPNTNGGIPWMVILDPEGKPLITSDGPQGNIGFPIHPPEIAYFIVMLQKTARRLTLEDIATIEAGLQQHSAPSTGY